MKNQVLLFKKDPKNNQYHKRRFLPKRKNCSEKAEKLCNNHCFSVNNPISDGNTNNNECINEFKCLTIYII